MGQTKLKISNFSNVDYLQGNTVLVLQLLLLYYRVVSVADEIIHRLEGWCLKM